MPPLTPGVSPKSSALTMSRRVTGGSPGRRPLDHEPLDGFRDPGRHRRLRVEGPDVLETLEPDAGERLDLAADDRRREACRLDLLERRLAAEEREEREDQPAAWMQMSRRAGD